ncbi:MAG: metallophosphoesterase [Polaromonas sp.]
MNIRLLAIVSVLFHTYVGARLLPGLAGSVWAVGGLTALLVTSALVMPLGLGLGMRSSHGLRPLRTVLLTWAGLLFMGLFSSLLVLTLLRDASLLVLWAVGLAWPAVAAPDWAATSAQAVPLLALAVTVWGFVNARRTAAVVRVDVPVAGLATALHGFTLAQISDIHVGPTIRRAYLQRIVQRVNALGADVVAVTGDLVDGSVPELAQHVGALAGLQSRHGTFFVTGNHEYYSGAHAWVDELRRIGLTVLLNEHVVLHTHQAGHPPTPLVLAGVTDFNADHFDPAHRSDPAAALHGAPAGALRVLLAHQPRSAVAAASAGFDLQISGHTHGGQFWPWNLFVPLQQPFTAGLNRLHNLWVYTSRGTGYWGPPKRFGAPSEITLLRLVTAD